MNKYNSVPFPCNERELLFYNKVGICSATVELLNHISKNNLYFGVVLMVCEALLCNLWQGGLECVRFCNVLNKAAR